MSVFRINKTKNYTVMSNYHLQDKNLSYKAKGLLSFMLSLSSDWDYSLSGLVTISKESKDCIRSILNELKVNHYLQIEKQRGDKGLFEYNYLIYEIPKNKTYPSMDIPYLEEPDMENHTQINTNIINTKKNR